MLIKLQCILRRDQVTRQDRTSGGPIIHALVTTTTLIRTVEVSYGVGL